MNYPDNIGGDTPRLLENTKKDWEVITQEVFSQIFKKSAVKRTKYEGFKRNIDFLQNQKF